MARRIRRCPTAGLVADAKLTPAAASPHVPAAISAASVAVVAMKLGYMHHLGQA